MWALRGALVGLVLLLVAAAPAAAAPSVRVLSNRADLISAGDALVEVTPAGAKVAVGARDVTGSFAVRPGGRYMGLLQGLAVGPNVVTARAPDGTAARITIVNHPQGGPVIDGPQIQPWKCFDMSVDAQC